ncbi:hypothetical protein [Flavobacterium marginilacus]|uniref:hypothetical protein n=1 Tax=Flavobacterium marginilacus TaxID=3003256 RepID=UPI00248E26B5|nr:hypothetical protein [Flavobacterium marginilacus]
MRTDYFIAKDRKLPLSQDYEFLRKEGMKYIEKLGNKFWTDYNAHDPGITILEVLSYAITELGYRTTFDIKNILCNKFGEISNNSFFPASTIFSNAPLTEIDYRKLLIDIDGISNAWFLATRKTADSSGFPAPHDNEIPIYINPVEDKLSLKPVDKNNTALQKLPLRGLNKIVLELEEDPILGDLNSTLLDFEFLNQDQWIQVNINPMFDTWSSPKANLLEALSKPAKIKSKKIKKIDNKVVLTLFKTPNGTEFLTFTISCYDPSEIDLVFAHFSISKNYLDLVTLFKDKKNKVDTAFQKVHQKLHQNRNFTEDYLCLSTIESIEIGICVDIEIEAQSNVVDVMAQIQIAIFDVINPPIRFYTLTQLLNEGYHSEDLFLGPKLDHGFLKDEELIHSSLPTAIHSSDIIAVLMDVKGVISVSNLLLTAYDKNGKPVPGSSSQPWSLNLSGEVNPVFTPKKSKILLFQKKIPFLLSENNQMLVDQKIEIYKSQQKKYKLLNTNNELPYPSGTFYQLDEFYSIQDEFPQNYGLGKNQLSDKESDLRKAQVKQLKGYLHFYDQILADFFNQLYNSKNILDTKTIDRTYFPKFLSKNDWNGGKFYSNELYTSSFEENLWIPTDDHVTIYENKTNFYERRNRALDHLMARFGESFNEYVFMMYQVNQDAKGLGELSFQYEDLIQDKQNFINAYPEISSKRGVGMDYIHPNTLTPPDFWNSNSRGGYEKRVAKLLGINSIILRDIVHDDTPQSQLSIPTKLGIIHFKIQNPATDLIIKWNWLQEHIFEPNDYAIHKSGSKYYLYLEQDTAKIAKIDKSFNSFAEAYNYYNSLLQALNETFENFYSIEHILLRPFLATHTDSDLLTVCLQDDCRDEANNDPYSFKATIVLPGYLTRFRNLTFRKYAEKIFRQEAPAHVLLKICWVNASDMIQFQKAYKNWLESYRYFRIRQCSKTLLPKDETSFLLCHKQMITALNELNTMYPEGNLFDCHLSETTNPILLGNTALGTL